MEDKNTLFLDRKTAVRLSTGLIVGFFAVFTTGYFIGKRNALQEVALQVQTESFGDSVTTALDEMYQSKHYTYYNPFQQEDQEFAFEEQEGETPTPDKAIQETSTPSTKYYAELIGFGARRNAEAFVQKMDERSIEVTLQERTSTTKKGKLITWFQILTPQFDHKQNLEEYISDIKNYEKLHDIHIREVHA